MNVPVVIGIALWIIISLITYSQAQPLLICSYTYEIPDKSEDYETGAIELPPTFGIMANVNVLPLRAVDPAISLGYDLEQHRIYLASPLVYKMNIAGGQVKTLAEWKNADRIAVDSITKNVYLVDEQFHNIKVCERDSDECDMMVRDVNSHVRDIALHPQTGTMYWSDWGRVPGIYKSSMDGTGATLLNLNGGKWTRSVTVDSEDLRLIWINDEGIWTSNFEGHDEYLLGPAPPGAINCTFVADRVFWVDQDTLKSCVIRNCSKFEAVKFRDARRSQLGAITFVELEMPPRTRHNPCANASCLRTCVLTGQGYKCACPSQYPYHEDLNPDSRVPHSPDPKSRPELMISHPGITGLAFDIERGRVYWGASSGEDWQGIYETDLDGNNIVTINNFRGNSSVLGLAYDWIAENVYYADGENVFVCTRRGLNCTELYRPSGSRYPGNDSSGIQSVKVDPNNGMIVVKATHYIACGSMDGNQVQHIVYDHELQSGFAVDQEAARIVFADCSSIYFQCSLHSIAYGGGSKRLVETVRKTEAVQAIAVLVKEIYWTDGRRIHVIFDKEAHVQGTTISRRIADFGAKKNPVLDMALFHRATQPRTRVNHCAGKLCSSGICVLTVNYFKCIGPERFKASNDESACVTAAVPGNATPYHSNGECGHNYTCSNGACFEFALVCDGKLDCDDCSDEGPRCDESCANMGCRHACHLSPRGPRCACLPGYRVALDGISCEDLDECTMEPAVCENTCVNYNGSYECIDNPSDYHTVAIAATIPTVVSLLVVAIAACAVQKYWQARKVLRRLTPVEIKEFLEGNESVAVSLDNGVEKAMLLPFHMTLQPEDVTIARDAVLGSGNFGIVYRGFYKSEAVAIKTFKKTVEIDEFKAVLAETKIMAYLGHHEHVIKLIGADISQISERKIELVMELSPHGDLLHYLRKIDPSCWQAEARCTPEGISPHTLVSWCSQIASGMEHLESKKVVHGDLAARNILVFKENCLKITDFGLSKQLYANSEYRIKRTRPLPRKWCALELLTKQEYSTDSDIWAFGVTAWEIFSLGRQPYEQHHDLSVKFIQYLEQGHRLSKPEYATPGIYEILLECWNIERSSRPRFAFLQKFFADESMNFAAAGRYATISAEDDHYYVCTEL